MFTHLMPHKNDKYTICYTKCDGFLGRLGAINTAEMLDIVEQLTRNGLRVEAIIEK